MEYLDSPAIDSNILARDDKSVEDEQASQEVHLLLHEIVSDRAREVKKDDAAHNLCWHDPRLPLTDAWKVIQLNEWSPKHLEAVRHGGHHHDSDFLIC